MAIIEDKRLDNTNATADNGLATGPVFDDIAKTNGYNNKAPNLLDLTAYFGIPNTMSREGQEYIATLKRILTENISNSANKLNIDVFGLNNPRDSVAVMNGNDAVVLVFDESNASTVEQPTSHYDQTAKTDLLRVKPEARLIKFIVVTKEDYPKVSVMANYICTLFKCAMNTADVSNLGIDSLKNMNFSYSENAADYEDANRYLNPHGTLLRHDMCLTIYATSKNHQPQYGWQQENQRYYADTNNDRIVIGAIGAYVEFVKQDMNSYKFYPIIHISEITTHIPVENLIPVFLSLAVRKFLLEETWWTQYASLGNGNKINIGNLVPFTGQSANAKDAPQRWFCANQADLMKMKNEYLYPAQVVMDVTQGRASILGIEQYAINPEIVSQSVIASFNKYMTTPLMLEPSDRCMLGAPFYRGTFPYGTKVLDSAHIDFLMEYSKCPANGVNLEKLMYQQALPSVKANELKEVEPEVKMLYRTDTVMLPVRLMNILNQQLSVLNYAGFNGMAGLFNTSIYGVNANLWANVMNNNFYGYNNGFYPFAQVYSNQPR